MDILMKIAIFISGGMFGMVLTSIIACSRYDERIADAYEDGYRRGREAMNEAHFYDAGYKRGKEEIDETHII